MDTKADKVCAKKYPNTEKNKHQYDTKSTI